MHMSAVYVLFSVNVALYIMNQKILQYKVENSGFPTRPPTSRGPYQNFSIF